MERQNSVRLNDSIATAVEETFMSAIQRASYVIVFQKKETPDGLIVCLDILNDREWTVRLQNGDTAEQPRRLGRIHALCRLPHYESEECHNPSYKVH